MKKLLIGAFLILVVSALAIGVAAAPGDDIAAMANGGKIDGFCNSTANSPPTNLINGSGTASTAVKWCCRHDTQPHAGIPHWVTVDFGEEKSFDRIFMNLAQPPEGSGYNAAEFYFEVSNDNVTWVKIDEVSGNSKGTYENEFFPIKARYLKLTVTQAEQNKTLPNYGTIRIYVLSVFESEQEGTFPGTTAADDSVTYRANNGSFADFKVKFEPGAAHTVPAFAETGLKSPAGRTFKEWNTKFDGTGTAYAPGAAIPNMTEGLTLYATYDKSVSFEPKDDPLSDTFTPGGMFEAFADKRAPTSGSSALYGLRYRAANGVLSNVTYYPEFGAVGDFEEDGAELCLYIDVPQYGFYDITFLMSAPYLARTNQLRVNDISKYEINAKRSSEFNYVTVDTVYLATGINKLSISKLRGSVYIRNIYVKKVRPAVFDDPKYNIPPDLNNPNATDNTKRLMQFLSDNYGKRNITGVHAFTGLNHNVVKAIYNEVGDYPAMLEFDMTNYGTGATTNPTGVPASVNSQSILRIIEWGTGNPTDKFASDKNPPPGPMPVPGLVTACWHWRAPRAATFGGNWEKPRPAPEVGNYGPDYYVSRTNFDISKAFLPGSYASIRASGLLDLPFDEMIEQFANVDAPEYKGIMFDLEMIASEFKKLTSDGLDIPVLWRPLHESAGAWFWWGAKGADNCNKLWVLMYKYLTEVHQVNNLIWVWNSEKVDWYPGDEFVDIISMDQYPAKLNYSPYPARFDTAYRTTPNKMVAYSETGVIPDVNLMIKESVMWSWVSGWDSNLQADGVLKETDTENYMLRAVYSSPYSYTLSNLPNIYTYEKSDPSAGEVGLEYEDRDAGETEGDDSKTEKKPFPVGLAVGIGGAIAVGVAAPMAVRAAKKKK